MTQLRITAPNGLEIDGTLEVVHGRGLVNFDLFNGHLVFEYAGETKIFWEEQRTVEQNGKTVYLDTDGNRWTEDQLTIEVAA